MQKSIASFIDHAVLHPTQTDEDLKAACELCAELKVASICVKPYAVSQTKKWLKKSSVAVSTVIGFPHGANTTEIKLGEAHLACEQGAKELDIVVNLGKIYSGDWDYTHNEIQSIINVAQEFKALTKIIFETGLLTEEQKIQLCKLSEQCGADFVKTSTGFGNVKQEDGSLRATGATIEDLKLMREHCSSDMGLKASGGIRSYADALQFIELGATRLGTSSTKMLVEQQQGAQSGSDQNSSDY